MSNKTYYSDTEDVEWHDWEVEWEKITPLACAFKREQVIDDLCCPTCSWTYTSTTTNLHETENRRHIWEVFDNFTNKKIAQHDDGTSSIFIYTWPYKSEFRVKLTVSEFDVDTCSTEELYFDEDCFEPCPPTGFGGGGAVPTYRESHEAEPECDIRIKKVYLSDLDEWKEPIQVITIRDVKFE